MPLEPDPNIDIRPADVKDIPDITAIYGHHVRHGLGSFEEKAPEAEEMVVRWRAIAAAGYPYVVAQKGRTRMPGAGGILGYAYLSAYRPRPAYRFTVEDSVYVAPKCQGLGVGQRLLAHLIERAQALGYRQMVAMIGDRGNKGSIRLHEKLGFERAGLLPAVGYKHGGWVDVVILQRPIGPGRQTGPGLPH